MSVTTPVAVGARSGRWMAEAGFGVYVHIPFCKHRCAYCDFNTYEGLEHLQEAYVDALVREIERWDGDVRPATSIFFGGGTPTLLAPAQLGRVVGAIRRRIGLADDAEITVEANPETVDEARLAALLDAGFNRVSIGVQSLVPSVLKGLDRTHPAEVALAAIAAARRAGFDDVNADLIYGSPWETDEDWVRSLQGIVAAEVDHVSAYALTIEEGTPLATRIHTGRAPDVDPDVQAARYEVAQELLGAAGFERYEISNWARPGRASRHNVLYWSAGDYLGFGAGAHAHVAGHRWWSKRLPREFIAAVDAGSPTVEGSEHLDDDARLGEALMLGLRLRHGVDLRAVAERFGQDLLERRSQVIGELVAAGWLERVDERLRVAEKGTLLANDICCRLL
ncbi:MAG TPA: radical SAM family heme chaperone HemW [Actinomycetota bacterium]|nr:radical SAM family heme chaperone HemW [Actinomycetota bacterium]